MIYSNWSNRNSCYDYIFTTAFRCLIWWKLVNVGKSDFIFSHIFLGKC